MTKESSSKSARPSGEIPDGHVAVGRVLAPLGVRGEIKVEPLAPPQTFSPGRSVTLRAERREIKSSRRHKGAVLLKLAGINTPEEIASLYQACDTALDRALILTLAGGGVRRSELLAIQIGDIDHQGRILIHGKGRRQRHISPGPQTLQALDHFHRSWSENRGPRGCVIGLCARRRPLQRDAQCRRDHEDHCTDEVASPEH